MKIFEKPVVELIVLKCKDIITSSYDEDDDDLDDDGFNKEIVNH